MVHPLLLYLSMPVTGIGINLIMSSLTRIIKGEKQLDVGKPFAEVASRIEQRSDWKVV